MAERAAEAVAPEQASACRRAVMAFMGVFGVTEIHHVVEALAKGAYDLGVVTCVPYAIAGTCLVLAVWREFQRLRHPAVAGLVATVQG